MSRGDDDDPEGFGDDSRRRGDIPPAWAVLYSFVAGPFVFLAMLLGLKDR